MSVFKCKHKGYNEIPASEFKRITLVLLKKKKNTGKSQRNKLMRKEIHMGHDSKDLAGDRDIEITLKY